ncbi:nucleoprotein [Ramu stunt virus]|uniref:Nucleoprotein n=1 Tax=Ramu stunt virus TaxID=1738604 RepID=A0A0P0HWZ2_9VIRU|nr:nucleoprotein [Ramu stunt virus]
MATRVASYLDELATTVLSEADEKVLEGFIYSGFDPVKMWDKIHGRGWNKQKIITLFCAAFQKGFTTTNFLKKVKDDTSSTAIAGIVALYGITNNTTASDSATILRMISSAPAGAFTAFKHVETNNRLNITIEPATLNLKCPIILAQPFINAMCGDPAVNKAYECLLIINEFFLAEITWKTMPQTIKERQGITDVESALLKGRTYYNAARKSPLVVNQSQREAFATYVITTKEYRFVNSSATAQDVSASIIDDLNTIHERLFKSAFRTNYVPIGDISKKMKELDSPSFKTWLTAARFPNL